MNEGTPREGIRRLPLVDLLLLVLILAAVYLYAREPSRVQMLKGTFEWFRALFGG